MPLLEFSFGFPSHDPSPAVVGAHQSHGLVALSSLLLETREDFLEGQWYSQNWVFDLTKKNTHFTSLAILINTQSPERCL